MSGELLRIGVVSCPVFLSVRVASVLFVQYLASYCSGSGLWTVFLLVVVVCLVAQCLISYGSEVVLCSVFLPVVVVWSVLFVQYLVSYCSGSVLRLVFLLVTVICSCSVCPISGELYGCENVLYFVFVLIFVFCFVYPMPGEFLQ